MTTLQCATLIAAVAPDAGETIQYQLDKYPSEIFARIEVADGRVWLQPNGTEFFCGDLSEEEQKVVWATHYAPTMGLEVLQILVQRWFASSSA